MIKTQNLIKDLKASNHKIHNILKRIKGYKKLKTLKNKKIVRLRKNIYFKNKIKKRSNFSDINTNFSDTSSLESLENSFEYKIELFKLINKITKKYKIISEITKENINDKINNIMIQDNKDKINIILDIDQTLVYSYKVENDKSKVLNSNINNYNIKDNHYIEFYIGNQKYIYNIQVRNDLKQFITKLSKYCNFYVNTMANPTYIKAVLTLLNEKYNLNLNNNGINNVFITFPNNKKTLPPEITKDGNFLILDDNICAWDESYFSNIIPVKKFYGIFNEINSSKYTFDTIYQYYLFTNKIYCFNEYKREFYDLNKLPFCCEASWSDINQLNYIAKIIIKSYFLSKLLKIPIYYSYYNIINNILNNIKIYYEGEDKPFIQDLVLLLGGQFVLDINEAKYILIKGNKNNFVHECKNNEYKLINIKWLFDSYFTFNRCEEKKYKIEY
jgi:hypothetical protein